MHEDAMRRIEPRDRQVEPVLSGEKITNLDELHRVVKSANVPCCHTLLKSADDITRPSARAARTRIETGRDLPGVAAGSVLVAASVISMLVTSRSFESADENLLRQKLLHRVTEGQHSADAHSVALETLRS